MAGVMTGWHAHVAPELRELLSIPEDHEIGATIPLGNPQGRHGPVRRRPISEVVFDDAWGQPAPWALDPPGAQFTQAGTQMNDLPASFSPNESDTVLGPTGQRVHRDSLAHSQRLERKLWTVRPGVWCLVGNGLSNQTFVEGPDGVIAIDTGECVEEMESALAELATVTDSPVVAVFYTHSHYVGGTTALPEGIPIWGHERVVENLRAYGAEFSAIAGSGLVHQFGMTLLADGEDGLVNVGLGLGLSVPGARPVHTRLSSNPPRLSRRQFQPRSRVCGSSSRWRPRTPTTR